jgi:TonB family protein
VSTLVAASPDLKKLWIRVLKRVHPDLAVDEQDRRRCERLTQQANDAYTRCDEVALRAVLEGQSPPRHTPPDDWEPGEHASTYQPPLVPQQPPNVTGREAAGILCASGAVLCLLLYGIFDALREKAGRNTSLSLLVLLTAVVLWLITQHTRLSYNQKARWVAAVSSGMMLVGICLLDSRPGANPLFPSARAATAQARVAPAGLRDSDTPPPSPWYWDVIKSRVAQSWNPSAVVETPAGATADVTFTIARDGSPSDVQLVRPSGYPALDSSCVLAVQQVRTFGPPEGGTKDSLKVLYPCSYHELESMYGHRPQSDIPQENSTAKSAKPEPVESLGSQLGGYAEEAKNKVGQEWDLSEVAGSTPAGATVYIQFSIGRRGKHEVPTVETPSGYLSLDVSCLAAVDRIETFGPLPSGYSGSSLTVLYHCTYPGPATAGPATAGPATPSSATSGSPATKLAQDSTLPPGRADGVHGAQPTTSAAAVHN